MEVRIVVVVATSTIKEEFAIIGAGCKINFVSIKVVADIVADNVMVVLATSTVKEEFVYFTKQEAVSKEIVKPKQVIT